MKYIQSKRKPACVRQWRKKSFTSVNEVKWNHIWETTNKDIKKKNKKRVFFFFFKRNYCLLLEEVVFPRNVIKMNFGEKI